MQEPRAQGRSRDRQGDRRRREPRVQAHPPQPEAPARRPAQQGNAGPALERDVLSARRAASATRLGARFLDDGSKERFCKKCGAGVGQIAPAKTAHATAGKQIRIKPPKRPSRQEVSGGARSRNYSGGDHAPPSEDKTKSTTRHQPPRRRRRGCKSATRKRSCPQLAEEARPRRIASRCRGSRRSSSAWASAARSPTRSTWKRPTAAMAEITGQKPVRCKATQEHRRLPLARGLGRRLQGDAPPGRGCTSSWTG